MFGVATIDLPDHVAARFVAESKRGDVRSPWSTPTQIWFRWSSSVTFKILAGRCCICDRSGQTVPQSDCSLVLLVPAVDPPSAGRMAPVMNLASSDNRKAMTAATSAGSPIRPIGWARRTRWA